MTMPGQQFEKYITTLLRDLVTLFVKYPADLEIKASRFQTIMDIQWRGNRADTPRMIGGHDGADGFGGQTYFHLKQLMRLVGEQHGYEVDLARVGQPVKGEAERYAPFKADPSWPRARIIALLERTAIAGSQQPPVIQAQDLDAPTTAVAVTLSSKETLKTETQLRDSLRHIFKVIGNANGRVIKVMVMRGETETEQQPATAAGRFAKVKEI